MTIPDTRLKASQDISSAEWTVVSHKKHQSSLRRKKSTCKHQRHLAKAKEHLELLEGEQIEKEPTEEEITRLIRDVQNCMIDAVVAKFYAQDILNASKDEGPRTLQDYVHQLKQIILESIDKKEEKNHSNSNSTSMAYIQEIICYGIGNFSKGSGLARPTSNYSSPMIQLASVLLLRKILALQTEYIEPEENSIEYQRRIPIRYFEPFMKPIEKKVLEYFQVELLENEQGKRRIISEDRKDYPRKSYSLFFMPHCPMRLYSNVLWANWFDLSKIIIFGNSFRAYDKRIIDSDLRNDESNSIFLILDCAYEREVERCGHRRTRNRNDDMGTNLDLAFNDCVVISFDATNNYDKWPPRPSEYFIDDNCTDSEII